MTADSRVKTWLIEDNSAYRASVARAINQTEGLVCPRTFSSFEQALLALPLPVQPDVLLLDIGLPGVDGITAMQTIRKIWPQTKIVILTVFEEPRKIFNAICSGASGYLLKTASLAELVQAIQHAVEGGAPMSPRVARLVLERFAAIESRHQTMPDYSLTDREREVLEFMAEGLVKREIADKIGVSVHTVNSHIRHIYEKLQVNTNTAAVAKAIREGLF